MSGSEGNESPELALGKLFEIIPHRALENAPFKKSPAILCLYLCTVWL